MTTEHSGSGDLTRSLDLLWGTKEQPSRGPKPGLSLEQIVVTAIKVANREGLAALSMRKVAAELGVGTMTLYRYVPGKGELLDLMLDHVNGPAPGEGEPFGPGGGPDRTGDLRAALERLALASWELYTGNPWLLQVNQARPLLGPRAMAGFEIALSALRGLGLTGRERVGIIVALDHYVTGAARTHVLAQQAAQESGVTDEEFWDAQLPYMERAMESGRYPEAAGLPEDAFSMTGEEFMLFGLAPLLDGIVRFVESRPGAAD